LADGPGLRHNGLAARGAGMKTYQRDAKRKRLCEQRGLFSRAQRRFVRHWRKVTKRRLDELKAWGF